MVITKRYVDVVSSGRIYKLIYYTIGLLQVAALGALGNQNYGIHPTAS